MATHEFDLIQKDLKELIKSFGVGTALNRTDVFETKCFIKISCQTYWSKIIKDCGLENMQQSEFTTIHIQLDLKHSHESKNMKVPMDVIKQKELSVGIKLSYCQAICKLLLVQSHTYQIYCIY